MPVLIWNFDNDSLGSIVRTGREVSLSAEEYRPEAEALDRDLDDLLDEAWHALNIITRRVKGKAHFDTFEQAWVLGRAVFVSEILRHEAMQGESRTLLWQAITHKAWYGICHDLQREPRWRDLIPSKSRKWRTNPTHRRAYRFLEIGYLLREEPLQDAGEVFGWKFSNANDLYDRASLRSAALLRAVLHWLRQQRPAVRNWLAKPIHGSKRHAFIATALSARFPASGPGSALMPQHYPADELRAIVCETLDAARDLHFPQVADAAT